jgi:hypothetical protein
VTFTPTAYLKGGTTLATTTDQAAQWFPASAAEWRNDLVDLTNWVGSAVVIRFTNINGYGNSLFIDNVNIQEATSIGEPLAGQSVSMYPNPGNGMFYISVGESLPACALSVHDMNGRLVMSTTMNLAASSPAALDLRQLPKGVYSVSLRNAKSAHQVRIVIL